MPSLPIHGYTTSFQEGGLTIKDSHQREFYFSFTEPLRFGIHLFSPLFRFKCGRQRVSLPVDDTSKALSLEFFTRWKKIAPETAKKAAFDYIDGQRGFVPVAFLVSLFFCLPLTIALLNDSRNQSLCTIELEKNSVLGEMQVTKFKKKRKGHYILNMEFTAPNGTKILGQDQLITQDEATIPKTVPVVYSPEKPSCWSLTPDLVGKEPNWAKRRYFAAFTLMFGTFFLIVTILGLTWSIRRYFQKRPLTRELQELFQL